MPNGDQFKGAKKTHLLTPWIMVATALAALATVYVAVIKPATLHSASADASKLIETHANGVHEGAVGRDEFSSLMGMMIQRFDRVDARLDQIMSDKKR